MHEKAVGMHIDELRATQRERAASMLRTLIMACQRKFLKAAHLLEIRSPTLDALASFGVRALVDHEPLLAPMAVLAERYVEHFFSPQGDLALEPGQRQDEKWDRYFHHVLLPHLLADDGAVRDVLRAVRALPSREAGQAASALHHLFTEMTLPETQPLWAHENDVDI